MKKILTIISAVLLFATVLVSCNNSTGENPMGLEFYLRTDDTYAVGCNSNKKHEKIIVPETYCGADVTKIADSGFSQMSRMIEIELPDSIKSIGEYAFSESKELASITVPDSVTKIGKYAFYQCDKLESVKLSKNITIIPENAFSGCDVLSNVTIPDGVTRICQGAFDGCDKLTSITVPESVTKIDSYAFSTFEGITINYKGSESEWKAIDKDKYWNGIFDNVKVVYNYDGK